MITADDSDRPLSRPQRRDPDAYDLCSLGERLREVREVRSWTRADVERLSQGRWTATALGTYERAERALTAVNLVLLAEFYRVPAIELLGGEADPLPRGPHRVVIIDTARLFSSTGWPLLTQFVLGVQQARSGPRRRLLRLRSRDIPQLAAIHGATVGRLLADLAEDKILIAGPGTSR